MALVSVDDQILVPAYGNGGFRAFQLDAQGLPTDRRARFVTSRESIFGRRSAPLPNAREATFPGAGAIFDSSTERLFTVDRFANRILVHDAADGRLAEFPSAQFVIGQPDATSSRRGIGPNRMAAISNAVLDQDNQRLFVADAPNHRIMVFDVHPQRLTNDPRAVAVIGQPDFESRDPGIGPSKFTGPSSVAYDPVNQRLFVSDVGNNRVLIFNADSNDAAAFDRAVAVMGQPDFDSRSPRQALDDFKAESIDYDWRHQRLFVAEDLEHRVMVYDAHPERVGGPTKALAVIGQPDAFSTHPAVSDTRVAMPRITVDSTKQKLYVSEGFPAGNRVSIWDIAPERLATGMRAVDVIGHETPEGRPDFFNRMAQGHLDGRSLAAARAVTLDPVDHRLFVSDEYNHRVVVWQLDALNRIDDYAAQWVLGQPDLNTSLMGEPSASNMTVPLAAAYDSSTKRLFVGDGYHNRILVYEAAPGRLASGMAASLVLGQPDFETVTRKAGADGLNFGVRMGRGIASDFLPMGFALDEAGQRLFVADGENNRVLIYDIQRGRLRNGAPAIGVIGQPDFDRTAPGSGATGLVDPGHLAYDPVHARLFVIDSGHQRVLAFDVRAERFANHPTAIAVIGRPDYSTPASSAPAGAMAALGGAPPRVTGDSFATPNGIAHDPSKQLLYIADGGGTFGVPADRILVFDVDPRRLTQGPTAIATLGAANAQAPAAAAWGGAEPVPGQFTIRDTRGIDIDPVNGRLFATGSFESRVVQFNFPRSSWRYSVAPGAQQLFATLDASDLGGRADERTVSAARVVAQSGGVPGGVAVLSRSVQTVDRRTERHSRRLISEAALGASIATRQVTLFVDGAGNRTHLIHAYNPGRRDAMLAFALRSDRGEMLQSWERRLPAGQQMSLELEGSAAVPSNATLAIDSTMPIALTALRSTINDRGESILAPAPLVTAAGDRRRAVAAYFANGGGQRSQLVLINSSAETVQGSVTFFDTSGRRTALGTRSDVLRYEIPPRSSWTAPSDGTGPGAAAGYAVVDSSVGAVPHAAVIVRHGLAGQWTNESAVSSVASGEARFAIDLRATLIRHGEIDVQVVVVNPTAEAATVRVALAGSERAAVELAPGEQTTLSVAQLGGDDARGLLTVSSDGGVVVTARQITDNIESQRIETDLPAVVAAGYFPYVANGGGLSTELRLANVARNPAAGSLEFVLPSGEPASATILR